MAEKSFKQRLHDIIFYSDSPAEKAFDIAIIILILISVSVVMLGSVDSINADFGHVFVIVEWVITVLFTLEYFTRIYTEEKKLKYIFSFYGIIDLLSILPTYLSIIISGANMLVVIRLLRLLRIFRVLKLVRYINASETLAEAISNSRTKILVFLEAVLIIVTIMGSLMYLIEGPEAGFTSIPRSIYWAIVTVTTVGYGDIAPQTPVGQLFAGMLMIVGFAIIAIPTSIIGSEIIKTKDTTDKLCPHCGSSNHHKHAEYCYNCGGKF